MEGGTDEVTGTVEVVVTGDDPTDPTDPDPTDPGPTDPGPTDPPAPGDTVAPDTSITDGPMGQGRGPAATFTFTSSEPGSTFECSLDGGAWAPCSSPATFNKLATGEHELRVRATDRAGNTDASPAARAWTVDRGKPKVKVLKGAKVTKDRTPSVRARLSDRYDDLKARDVKVRFDGRKAAKVRVNRKGVMVATSKRLAPGRHRVVIKVRDEAGNKQKVRFWITVRP
jgi:hypothetical protein